MRIYIKPKSPQHIMPDVYYPDIAARRQRDQQIRRDVLQLQFTRARIAVACPPRKIWDPGITSANRPHARDGTSDPRGQKGSRLRGERSARRREETQGSRRGVTWSGSGRAGSATGAEGGGAAGAEIGEQIEFSGGEEDGDWWSAYTTWLHLHGSTGGRNRFGTVRVHGS
jgi:hypothetical protein